MPIHKRLFIILSTVVFSLSSAGGRTEADSAAAAKINTTYQIGKDLKDRCDTQLKEMREQLRKYKTGCQMSGSITAKKIEQYNNQIDDDNEDLKVKLDSEESQKNGNNSTPQKSKSIPCEKRIAICEEAEGITVDDLKANAESETDPQSPMAKKIYEQLKTQYGIDLPDDEPKKGFFSRLCPMNYDEYKADADKAESEIKSLKSDLERERKEFPELQKKNAQTLKELNDKVTLAKDNYEKGQKENSQGKKSAEDTLFKKTLEIADQRNKFHTSIVANQLAQSNILDEIAKLNNMFSVANIQKICDPEYKKIAEQYSPTTNQAPLIRGDRKSVV